MNFNKFALGIAVLNTLSGPCLSTPQNNAAQNQDNTKKMVEIVEDFLNPSSNGKAADYAKKMRNICGNNMSPVQKQIVSFLEQKNKPGMYALWGFWKTVQKDRKLSHGLNQKFGNKTGNQIRGQIKAALNKRYA